MIYMTIKAYADTMKPEDWWCPFVGIGVVVIGLLITFWPF